MNREGLVETAHKAGHKGATVGAIIVDTNMRAGNLTVIGMGVMAHWYMPMVKQVLFLKRKQNSKLSIAWTNFMDTYIR